MEAREKIYDHMLDVFARLAYPSEKVLFFQDCWQKAREVFDLGCGNASYTAMLAGDYPDRRFTCVEANPLISGIAQERAGKSGINVITGSYEDMADDYKFDFLLARLVITHIQDMNSLAAWVDRHAAANAGILIIDADLENFCFDPGLPIFTGLFESLSKKNSLGGLRGLKEKARQLFKEAGFLCDSTQVIELQTSSQERKRLMYTYMTCVAQLGLGTPIPSDLELELSSWLENPDSSLKLALFGTMFTRKNNTLYLAKPIFHEPKKEKLASIDCLHDFDDDMRKVFASCREQISLYPQSLRQDGLDFLEKYDLFNKDSHKNYISYLLPFWLQPYFNFDYPDLIKLSAGNTFLMLYIILQDDVMDTAPGEYKAGILPLGNMFYLDFCRYYRCLFPSDSVFWEYLRKFFAEWADSVIWEREQHWNQQRGFSFSDMANLAKKAAPLKAACAAACLLCDREEALEPLCGKVDHIFILLQLLDDWADWQEDLSAGNCTYFLSEAMKYSKVDCLDQLTVSHITDAVFYGNILEKVFAAVKTQNPAVKKIADLHLPYLDAFIEILLKNCDDIISGIQAEKTARLEGGLTYWLLKNDKF